MPLNQLTHGVEGVSQKAGRAMNACEDKLIKMSAQRPLTAREIGEVMNVYGPDAVTRLRGRKHLQVTVIGKKRNKEGYSNKLYKVQRVLNSAYCCGYCEQQRQLEASIR